MSDFVVWDPAEGDALHAGRTIKASCADGAAKHFISRGWEGEEFAREIHVQDEHGEVTRWSVRAVPSVEFHATPIAAKEVA